MTTINVACAIIFALALIHSFSASWIEHWAGKVRKPYANILHLLGEVEIVFGFWAIILLLLMALISSPQAAVEYAHTRNYTESFFVFVIMVVAASRPILNLAQQGVERISYVIPLPTALVQTWLLVGAVPLLGSFITEPAAMTLSALMLYPLIFKQPNLAEWKKYAVLGVLFVNVSIGGALTNFAAPPILMVAMPWQWTSGYVFQYFGHSALIAVLINATLLVIVLRRDLSALAIAGRNHQKTIPMPVTVVHLIFLIGIIYFAHYPVFFLGLFALFVGFTQVYARYQSPLIYKEAFLVAFFLTGLVVVGGMQEWWIKPLLGGLAPSTLFFGAAGLTAITDNAAVTYLGTLVPNLSEIAKYMLVSGAVVGGGLTLIANAPNPAGAALLKNGFQDRSISMLGLLLGALIPTCIAALSFFFISVPI